MPQKARVVIDRVYRIVLMPPGHPIILLKSNQFNMAAVSVGIKVYCFVCINILVSFHASWTWIPIQSRFIVSFHGSRATVYGVSQLFFFSSFVHRDVDGLRSRNICTWQVGRMRNIQWIEIFITLRNTLCSANGSSRLHPLVNPGVDYRGM